MKKMYKYAIALFCAIALLAGCFCKKEDCPKLNDSQKNPMNYKNEQVLFFENKDIENNRIDTLQCRVSIMTDYGHVPCSHPDPNQAGNCSSSSSTNIFSYLVKKKEDPYPNELNKFSPRYCLEYDSYSGKHASNYYYHYAVQTPIIVKGEKYENYFVDSLLNGSTCNQKYDSIQRVIYWNNDVGLFLAKQYEKGVLVNEMLLLK